MPEVGLSDAADPGPRPPTALQILSGSSTGLTLTWRAGLGGTEHTFELLRDGKTVATTVETSFTFAGLSCGMAYNLGVKAFDAARQYSALASVVAAPDACQRATPAPPAVEPTRVVSPLPAPPVAPELPERDATSTEMAWSGAGAFVWHETDVAPEVLGAQLRENGFSWVAVRLHDGLAVDPVEGGMGAALPRSEPAARWRVGSLANRARA